MRQVKKCCVALLSVVLLSGGMVLADGASTQPGDEKQIDQLLKDGFFDSITFLEDVPAVKKMDEAAYRLDPEKSTNNLINYWSSYVEHSENNSVCAVESYSVVSAVTMKAMPEGIKIVKGVSLYRDKKFANPALERANTNNGWKVTMFLQNPSAGDNIYAVPGALVVDVVLFDRYDETRHEYVKNWTPTLGDLRKACPTLLKNAGLGKYAFASEVALPAADKSALPPSAVTDGSIKPETGSTQVSGGAPSDLNTSKPVSQ